jgi:hypothetical protein
MKNAIFLDVTLCGSSQRVLVASFVPDDEGATFF